jgi:hypothetical protein
MGTRWLGTLRRSNHAASTATADAPSSVPEPASGTSWRAWLATGARQAPIDRRRARGMDHRIKNVLFGGPSGAVDFPSAMARQTVDEAMSELPSEHRQVLKLAFLAGLTNREIATQLGLTVGGVRRRLRQGLEMIGAYVERGRATGRRAIHGLAWWLSWRHLDHLIQRANGPSLDQILQAGVVAAMTVATTAILMTHHTSPAVSHPHKTPRIAAVGPSSHSIPKVEDKTAAAAAAPQVASAQVSDVVHQATSAANVPIKVQLPEILPVRLPTAPSL